MARHSDTAPFQVPVDRVAAFLGVRHRSRTKPIAQPNRKSRWLKKTAHSQPHPRTQNQGANRETSKSHPEWTQERPARSTGQNHRVGGNKPEKDGRPRWRARLARSRGAPPFRDIYKRLCHPAGRHEHDHRAFRSRAGLRDLRRVKSEQQGVHRARWGEKELENGRNMQPVRDPRRSISNHWRTHAAPNRRESEEPTRTALRQV